MITANPTNSIEAEAWEMYCAESAGGLIVADFWFELPQRIREHYLSRVTGENHQ